MIRGGFVPYPWKNRGLSRADGLYAGTKQDWGYYIALFGGGRTFLWLPPLHGRRENEDGMMDGS